MRCLYVGMVRSLVLLLLATIVSSFALENAADWPCFQGPLGNGASPKTGLLHFNGERFLGPSPEVMPR